MTFKYVCFSITDKCNLMCPYCYRLDPSCEKNVSKETFEKCIKGLVSLGCKVINISGGEPLLNPLWRDLVNIVKAYGLNVILSTNGIGLDIDEPILKSINVLTIPIDGYNDEVNSLTRGANHFDNVMSIVKRYSSFEHSFRLKINTVMTRYNYATIQNISHYIKRGMIWKVFYCQSKGYYNIITKENMVSPEEFVNKIMEVKAMPIKGYFMYEDGLNSLHGKEEDTVINPDGDVFLCKNTGNILIGNLLNQTPDELKTVVSKEGLIQTEYKSFAGLDHMFL